MGHQLSTLFEVEILTRKNWNCLWSKNGSQHRQKLIYRLPSRWKDTTTSFSTSIFWRVIQNTIKTIDILYSDGIISNDRVRCWFSNKLHSSSWSLVIYNDHQFAQLKFMCFAFVEMVWDWSRIEAQANEVYLELLFQWFGTKKLAFYVSTSVKSNHFSQMKKRRQETFCDI